MKETETLAPTILLKAYSQAEVARLYQVSDRTMRTWLIPFRNEIGPRLGHYYNPKQMKIIFEKLGIPDVVNLN